MEWGMKREKRHRCHVWMCLFIRLAFDYSFFITWCIRWVEETYFLVFRTGFSDSWQGLTSFCIEFNHRYVDVFVAVNGFRLSLTDWQSRQQYRFSIESIHGRFQSIVFLVWKSLQDRNTSVWRWCTVALTGDLTWKWVIRTLWNLSIFLVKTNTYFENDRFYCRSKKSR